MFESNSTNLHQWFASLLEANARRPFCGGQFGDKHSLFVESLHDYFERCITPAIDLMEGEDTGIEAIESFFGKLGRKGFNGFRRGCMLTNAVTELSPDDRVVSQMSRGYVERIESAFRLSVQAAQQKGELRSDISVEALSRMLVALMHGILVQAKLPGNKKRLRDAIGGAIESIRV